ncbi:MAG: hypothetical protein O3C60_14915, partial [Planctomycetota bacterium]|nr:hypothetical protein [Planctomycetota bacterium]
MSTYSEMAAFLPEIDTRLQVTGERFIAAARRRGFHSGAPNQLRHTAATQARREYGLEAAQSL